MPTTIKLQDTDGPGRSVSFMEIYRWLLATVGERKTWRSSQITGQGWRMKTVSMLLGHILVEIDDDQKAMLFVLQFGGQVIPPEDVDTEWQK